MGAWNHWYHCTAHTYGTWLRGDPRGWRARHHREHVEGDYKNPPPKGRYAKLLAYSKSLMKRDTVRLDDLDVIEFVLLAVIDRLIERKISTRIGCFDGVHLHLLVQCPNGDPKIVVGIAKQYATAQMKAHGLAVGFGLKIGEGIWAKGSHAKPITNAGHLDRATGYIHDHIDRRAVVWQESEFNLDPARCC
jgi:hypothetical protein